MMVKQEFQKDALVITLIGPFDSSARTVFHATMDLAKETQASRIILDLESVPFLDSTALGLLFMAHNTLAQSKVELVLVTQPHEYVQSLFRLTNMDAHFSIFPSVHAALAQQP